jgi:hypothetical protein
VQFATFPETVVPYYPYFSFIQSHVQIIAGREHLKLLDQDRVHLSYESKASLLAPFGIQAALAVARDLDANIENLLKSVAR